MRLSLDQMLSDDHRMQQYICERIVNDGTKIVLAAGEEGESWAELYPIWDDEKGWELHMERSDEWVSLEDVYYHFRRKEMTWREWYLLFAPTTQHYNESAPISQATTRLAGIEAKLDQILDNTTTLVRQQTQTSRASVPTGEGAALTKQEVAQRFQISTRTLDRWRSMGIDLGEININGTPRFNPEKVATIIATQKVRRRRTRP
jgi:hypothetical protein